MKDTRCRSGVVFLWTVGMIATLIVEGTVSAGTAMETKQPQAMVTASSKQRSPFPSVVRRIAEATGDRFTEGEKACWTGMAELRMAPDKPVLATVQVMMEWPGKLVVSGPEGTFDLMPGKTLSPTVEGIYRDLAEILVEDTADGFLHLYLGWGAVRLVGTGYRDTSRKSGAVDVFGMAMTGRTRKDSPRVSKEYWFDSETHRLLRVFYGGEGAVEVSFSDWVTLENNSFPRRMTRYEKGEPTLDVTLTPKSIGPSLDNRSFSRN